MFSPGAAKGGILNDRSFQCRCPACHDGKDDPVPSSDSAARLADTTDMPALLPPPPAVRASGLTDVGRVRESNEDHFLIAELARTLWVRQTNLPQPATQYGSNRGYILLVADGLGGHRAGDVASALGLEAVEDYVLHLLRRFSNLRVSDEAGVLRDFKEALRQADARIVEEAARHPEYAGMGTTLTLAFVSGWRLFVFHAGDSRCYLYRGGQLRQVTADDTVAAELARMGIIKPGDVVWHRARHAVTNLLGRGTTTVHVERVDLQAGDAVLLCSDGLTEMLPDGRIAAVLGSESDPRAACQRLVSEANEAGGEDNITAVVARLEASLAGQEEP
jgi:protein phosphatase